MAPWKRFGKSSSRSELQPIEGRERYPIRVRYRRDLRQRIETVPLSMLATMTTIIALIPVALSIGCGSDVTKAPQMPSEVLSRN